MSSPRPNHSSNIKAALRENFNKRLNDLSAHQDFNPKNNFIDQFGVSLEMTANFIFETFFYGLDQKHLISACCQVFPKDVQFYDFDKIGTQEDPTLNEFGSKYSQISNQMVFKVFAKEEKQYQEKKFRICDPSYQKKICFSKDKTKLAIFREDNESFSKSILGGLKKSEKKLVIDIFDCSSIDFFLRDEPLTPSDQNLLFTISDKRLTDLHKEKKIDTVKLKFTQTHKFLFLQIGLDTIALYQLSSSANDKSISNTLLWEKLPFQYEATVGIGINEENIKSSLIGAKRKDFKVIDIFALEFLDELGNQSGSKFMTTQNILSIQDLRYNYGTIRLPDFNIRTTKIKFSRDNTKAILCDEFQSLYVALSRDKKQKSQKNMTHLQGKQQRKIIRYGPQDFLIATALPTDKSLTIRHSSDKSVMCKVPVRFIEGVVRVRDIFALHENKMSILLTMGDEEYLIYDFQNFEKQTFHQSIYECSKYIFEWPYICYQKLHNLIIIQNGFDPQKIIFIELSKLDKHSEISHIYLSDSLNLFIMVSTQTSYEIYVKDLNKCRSLLLKESKSDAADDSRASKITLAKSFNINLNQKVTDVSSRPIATIHKENINNKTIKKIFARSLSIRDSSQSNPERILFFTCDSQIFSIKSENNFLVEKVDNAKNFKQVRPDLLVYNALNKKGKKTNELKFIQVDYSDYTIQRAYEEIEGKMIGYIPSENQLYILAKLKDPHMNVLKIYNILSGNIVKYKSQLEITDNFFLGYMKNLEQVQNNMIPFGNNIYTLVDYESQTRIYPYKDVLPIADNGTEHVTLNSPIMSQTYRKMVYFISTVDLRPKRAIILPYLNDNFILFNKRETVSQYCQFDEFFNQNTKRKETDIISYVPRKQLIYHYAVNGRLQQIYKLDKEFEEHGNQTLAISPCGSYFLLHQEDDQDFTKISLIKIELKTEINEQKGDEELFTDLTLQDSEKKDPFTKSQSIVEEPESISSIERTISVQHIDTLDLEDIQFDDEDDENLHGKHIDQIIKFFKNRGCEIIFKMNENLDIIIGFVHVEKHLGKEVRTLKELLLLKKSGSNRTLYKLRISKKEINDGENQDEKNENEIAQNQTLTSMLLINKNSQVNQLDFEKKQFQKMQHLRNMFDFNVSNEKVVMWSKHQIYQGSLNIINSNTATVNMQKVEFEIDPKEEAVIENISIKGLGNDDLEKENYYIFIKVSVENSYSSFIKYNINKNKEFSSFDCSLQSQIFFDTSNQGYILDADCIVDINQGVPLYYYKTGIDSIQEKFIFGGLDRGSRFCSSNDLFMIKNKVYLPYSYMSFVVITNSSGKTLDSSRYDPDAYFCIGGETILHRFASDFKNLEFILNEYQKQNPQLINMILIKNKDGNNVLDIALEKTNARCVNLILEKLSKLQINNIHSLKHSFEVLLDYTGFEDYLKQCFFQTSQMKNKSLFKRKTNEDIQILYSAPHSTSFFDKKFMEEFQDPEAPAKPVIVRALDAGWILKENNSVGEHFLLKLSNSENMKYFEIDTVRLLVNYQWKIMKPLIIRWLFVPFLLGMIIFNIYCIYLFEANRDDNLPSTSMKLWNSVFQFLILLFTVQSSFVEYKQISFHRQAYLQSFWNLLDLSVVIMAPVIVILDVIGVDELTIRPIMAICMLIYYIRFFYFLRVFDNTAPLIRIITEITYDIRNFLFVFMVGVVGFGASFYILSNNINPDSENKDTFIKSFMMSYIYSYRMALGDFQVDDYDDTENRFILWTFFVLSSMFTAIILLNMLIAIMGESFNRINEESENQMFREHLQMIVENDFLFIDRKSHFGNVKYLIEIRDDMDDNRSDVGQNLALIAKSLVITDSKHDEMKQVQEREMNEMRQLIKTQGLQLKYIKDLLVKAQTDNAGGDGEKKKHEKDVIYS